MIFIFLLKFLQKELVRTLNFQTFTTPFALTAASAQSSGLQESAPTKSPAIAAPTGSPLPSFLENLRQQNHL